MQKPAHVVMKGLLVAGALALACVPMPAQRISVDTVRNGHFPEALRGRMDGRPDKSIHRLSPADIHDSAAANLAKPAAAPQPIVSPFFRKSSRSGSVNYGFLVGPNPFSDYDDSKIAPVKTYIVPIVIKVHQVADDFSVDANGYLTISGIKNQDATIDPTEASPACLGTKNNNVPFKLAVQSPVFVNHHWVWGGTDLGNAQYVEAFQRANFWHTGDEHPGGYDVRLNTETLDPVVIDFPVGSGIGLPKTSSFFGYSACARTALVDFGLFDEYLDYVVLPKLKAKGVNSGNFTMFIAGNVLWGAVINQLPYFEPQAAGYHSFSSVDPALTYGVTQFGDEGVFTWPDAVPLSHEVGEWMNDPTGANYVQLFNENAGVDPTAPPACQGNYETGDILGGVFMPPVKGENGYTYTLQELAFFSYFYGGPSIAANHWYSNNNTLGSDAGPACSPF